MRIRVFSRYRVPRSDVDVPREIFSLLRVSVLVMRLLCTTRELGAMAACWLPILKIIGDVNHHGTLVLAWTLRRGPGPSS
jgi:hypothetical protein